MSKKRNDNLKRTQQILWKYITAPEGVEKALEHFPLPSLPVMGDARLSAADRLDIYANMYFFRILDSIKEDFPNVLKIIGPDHFHNLITDYLIAHPPTHWSLRYAGQYLPKFLTRHPLSKRWPYLRELASFEWAILEAFDSTDASALTGEELKALDQKSWGAIPLRVVPSFRAVGYSWPIQKIFKRRGAMMGKFRREKSRMVLWRQGFKVLYRPSDEIEWPLFQSILKGATFSKVCSLVAHKKDPQASAVVMLGYFKRWLHEGILQSLSERRV